MGVRIEFREMDDESFKEKINNVVKRSCDPEAQRPYCYGDDTAAPKRLHAGKRIEAEFWCGSCRHYIYVKLNAGLEGNHIVVCPQCGHKHYRLVKNGVITSDRFHEGTPLADEIVPMKSAAVPAERRRKRGDIAILREMEAVGLLK